MENMCSHEAGLSCGLLRASAELSPGCCVISWSLCGVIKLSLAREMHELGFLGNREGHRPARLIHEMSYQDS